VSDTISLIWKLSILAELGVAVRLLLQGLGGEYPALLTACSVLPIKSLFLIAFYSAGDSKVLLFWKAAQPIEWVLYSWVVFELFSRWTRSYRGIGRFGKFLLAGLLAGALIVSIAFSWGEWKALVFAGELRIYFLLNRVTWATLGLFIVFTWLFFRNYPVAVAPNVGRHTRIAAFYYVTVALSEFAFNLTGLKVGAWLNLSLVTISLGCFSAWALLLTRKGQIVPQQQVISTTDKERIEKVNRELLVLMRKFPG